MSGSYFELVAWLRDQGKRVFCDLKFFAVPETVARAVRQLKHRGVVFATVHGNDTMLAAAREKFSRVRTAYPTGSIEGAFRLTAAEWRQ